MAETDLPVFKIENGEMVPIHGDVRDPTKRYRACASREGGYHVEFTEEEERARDAEEAQWEADRPLREAEEKERADQAERRLASINYEPRFALFFDILGWTDAVAASASGEVRTRDLASALDFLKGQEAIAQFHQKHSFEGDFQVTVFSDCIFASTDKHGLESLLSALWFVTSGLLQNGFLVRGGLTFGPLYHKDGMAFGPAMLRAHHLESKVALHPRVLLDESLVETLGQGVPVFGMDGLVAGRVQRWRRGADGHTFFDFLQPYPLDPPEHPSSNRLRATFLPVKDRILHGLSEYKGNARVRPKYIWLAAYFNEMLSEYEEHCVGLIDIDATHCD